MRTATRPSSFAKLASMSMELLGNEFHREFLRGGPPRAARARRDHLEGIVELFPGSPLWTRSIPVFIPAPAIRATTARAWGELMRPFNGDVDWRRPRKARG